MAKDPAFLFYPGDWMLGTMTMTRHEKGCYMDLLMAQFNSGPLTLNQITNLLGADKGIWATLSCKFKQTEAGLWFNERLELEKERRKSYTDSRSKNRKKTYDNSYDKTHDKHMSKHMESVNENENENENFKGGVGENFKTNNPEELINPDGPDQYMFEINLKNYGLTPGDGDLVWKTFCAKVKSEDAVFDQKQIWFRLQRFLGWYKKFKNENPPKENKRDQLKQRLA
jgi:uncharacterized protein YdaU (DUF1376 family)